MTNDKTTPVSKSIMVIGGGIAGLTTAIETAEMGYEVFLIEKNPYLGGRVAQLNQYFPKLCPPTCGLEINFRRIKDNPNIKIFTLAEVEKIKGVPGNYTVNVELKPRYVNGNCTCCGDCNSVCKTEIFDEYNLGMKQIKAAYLPFEMAFPARYVISPQILNTNDAINVKKACKYNAINLEMKTKIITIPVGAIVWATGWKPYNANKIDNLGFEKYKNVITNMMFERIASINGPSKGKILRPSDNTVPKSIAFIQCAGSRDENHLPYCSYVCCMASLKHATYMRKQNPDTKIYIFYIDIRSPGDRYEKFYKNIKQDPNIIFIRGKVAQVSENSTTKNIIVVAENSITGEKIHQNVDMAILATGMQPSTTNINKLNYDENGFIINNFETGGMLAAGCANKPADVISSNQNATGMAIKAIQTLVRR